MSAGQTEEPQCVEYFRNNLSQTTQQLEELCEHWTNVLAAIDPSHRNHNNNYNNSNSNNNQKGANEIEDEQSNSNTNGNSNNNDDDEEQQAHDAEQEDLFGAIRTTIGQAKLLMSQRFKQFSDLIDNCEFNTGQHKTTLNDLSGFWEMIGYQIEDVSEKFKSLEKRSSKLGCSN